MFVPTRSGMSAVQAVAPLAYPEELVDEVQVTRAAPEALPRNVIVAAEVDVIVIAGDVMVRDSGAAGGDGFAG
jgi:hypothetical protein